MTTGKTIALTRRTFVGKVMPLLLNMLSRLVITFLPRSERLLISWLQSPSAVIWEPKKIKSDTVSPSVSHEEISSLSHSIVFLYFFALIAEEGFHISPCYSLELCIQMLISFLFSFAFHFSSFHSYLYSLLKQPFCFLAFIISHCSQRSWRILALILALPSISKPFLHLPLCSQIFLKSVHSATQ